MKIIASYQRLLFLIGIPVALISFGLLWFFYPIITHIFKIHWIFLVSVLVFALIPKGKQRFDAGEVPSVSHTPMLQKQRLEAVKESPAPLKPMKWLMKIWLLQLCLYGVFFGISGLTPTQLFSETTQQLLLNEGLFPWGFIILIAISAGYRNYRQKKEVYPHTLVEPCKIPTVYQVTIDYCSRLATLLAFASSFAFISILWTSSVEPRLVTGFNLTPMLIGFIILFFSRTQFFKRQFKKTTLEKMPVVLGVYIWVIFFAVGVWLFNGLFSAVIHISVPPPSILQKWLAVSQHDVYLVFANCWWLCFAPIIGLMIAQFSKGYQIRQLCGGVLILPIILLVLNIFIRIPAKISPTYAIFIAAAGLLGLLILSLRKKNYGLFILNFLPRPGEHKYRSPVNTLIKTMQWTAGLIFLFLPSGFLISNLIFLSVSLLLLIIFCLILTGSSLKLLGQD